MRIITPTQRDFLMKQKQKRKTSKQASVKGLFTTPKPIRHTREKDRRTYLIEREIKP